MASMRKLKMLLVEDEYLSRQLLLANVVDFGTCDIAKDGLEALDAARKAYGEGRPYDLIFMDIMLPGMDGFTVLAELRNFETARGVPKSERCKVMMVTALSKASDPSDSDGSPFEGYITKPYSKSHLIQTICGLGFEYPGMGESGDGSEI